MTSKVTTPYSAITVVRDGSGYVLGSSSSTDFVAVPEIGGLVITWLQDGCDVEECARRAADFAGEPVDVRGFLDGLAQAGLLPKGDQPLTPDQLRLPAWKRRLGRLVMGPPALVLLGLAAVAGVAAMIADPRLRPRYTDMLATDNALVSVLLIAVIGMTMGMLHELAHVTAAWAAGVASRVSVSRRAVFIVLQTDLTRLWAVPRRRRVVPLIAGMLFDAGVVGLLVLLQAAIMPETPTLLGRLLRTLVYLGVGGITAQFLIFLRSDVYALYLVLTGCKNLWAVKGAVARKAIRRATADDLALLHTADKREIGWAKLFLSLYLPGILLVSWYYVVYAIPGTAHLIDASIDALADNGAASIAGAAGGMALLLVTATVTFTLWGLARTGVRLLRQVIWRQDGSPTVISGRDATSGLVGPR